MASVDQGKGGMSSRRYCPGIYNVLPEALRDSVVPDRYVAIVCVTFRSEAGKQLNAVHMLPDNGQNHHILLSGEKGGEEELAKTRRIIAEAYGVPGEARILHRSHDICTIVDMGIRKLTQGLIGEQVILFFRKKFSCVAISEVHFRCMSKEQQEKI